MEIDSALTTDFLVNLFANVLATALGVLAGLAIDRSRQKRKENIEKKELEDLRVEKQTRILVLLHEELTHNKNEIEAWENNTVDGFDKTALLSSQMKTGLWNALSDGGELESIKDIEALNSLSEAYFSVEVVKYLGNKYFDAAQLITDEATKKRTIAIAWGLRDASGVARRKIASTITDLIASIPKELIEQSTSP